MRGAHGAAARRGQCGAWLFGAAVALAPCCRTAAAAAVAPAAGTAARGAASPTGAAAPADAVSAVVVTANASGEASASAAAGTAASGTASAASASAANASAGGARAHCADCPDCSKYPDCPVDCTKCKQGEPDLTRDARPGERPTSVPREWKYSPGKHFRGMPDPLTESTDDRQRWQQEAMTPGYLSPGGDFVKNGPNELPPCPTKPQPSAAVARLAAAGAVARVAAALACAL